MKRLCFAESGANALRTGNSVDWKGYLRYVELLHKTPNITISLDPEGDILICTWMGAQQEEALQQAGAKMRELFLRHKCTKILNDNTHVIGEWDHSTAWASNEWFPRMIKIGLKKFAWVLAEDVPAQVSAYRVAPAIGITKTFISFDDALEWLRE